MTDEPLTSGEPAECESCGAYLTPGQVLDGRTAHPDCLPTLEEDEPGDELRHAAWARVRAHGDNGGHERGPTPSSGPRDGDHDLAGHIARELLGLGYLDDHDSLNGVTNIIGARLAQRTDQLRPRVDEDDERAVVCPGCSKARPGKASYDRALESGSWEEFHQAQSDYGPCCNPECGGTWGTGCHHCHHPKFVVGANPCPQRGGERGGEPSGGPPTGPGWYLFSGEPKHVVDHGGELWAWCQRTRGGVTTMVLVDIRQLTADGWGGPCIQGSAHAAELRANWREAELAAAKSHTDAVFWKRSQYETVTRLSTLIGAVEAEIVPYQKVQLRAMLDRLRAAVTSAAGGT